MSEADVQASAATIESPTINGGGENSLTEKPLEEVDTSDVPIASGGTGEKGANGILDAALTEGKEALSEAVSATAKAVNGVNGDLENVAVNGLFADAKDDEAKDGDAAEDVSLSKNEEPVVPEPINADADSSEEAAADVVKPEENSVVVPATDATEVVLSKTDELVTGAVPEAEQTTDATSSFTDSATHGAGVESTVEATEALTVEASEPVTVVLEEKVVAPTVEETAPVIEEPAPSVAVDSTEPVPSEQTPAPVDVVEAPDVVDEPTAKIAAPQVVAIDIPAEETLPTLSAATAEAEPQVVPEAVIAHIEDVPITNDVQTAPEAPIPEVTEVPPIADSAPEVAAVAVSKPIGIEAPVKEDPIKEVVPAVLSEAAPESTEEVSTQPDVVEVEEAESVHVATPEAPPAEAAVEGVAPAVEESTAVAEAPIVVEATPAEEPSTVVAAEKPVEPTKEPVEKVDTAEEVPVVEDLKPADVFEPVAPVVAEVAQAPPDLVEEEVKPAVEETEFVFVVEEKAVAEEVVPAVVDEVKAEEATPVLEEKPAEEPVEATQIVEDEKPAVYEVVPNVVEEALVMEEPPVIEGKEPVVVDEEPIAKEEPAIQEAEVAEAAKPFVQEETTIIEEKPVAREEPPVEEAKPPVREEVEAVVKVKPTIQEEPAAEEIPTAVEEETVVPEPEPAAENPEPAQEEPKVVDEVTPVEAVAKAADPKVEEPNEDEEPLKAVSDNGSSEPVFNEEEESKSTPEEAIPVAAANVEDTKSAEEEAKPAVDDVPPEATPLVENPLVAEEPAAPKTVDEEPESVEDVTAVVVESVAEDEAISSPPVETIPEKVEPTIHVVESLPVLEPEPVESAPSTKLVETEDPIAVIADEDSSNVKPTTEESDPVTEVEGVPTPAEAEPIQGEEEEIKGEETTQDTPQGQAPLVEEIKSETVGVEERAVDEVDVPTQADDEVAVANEAKPEIIEELSEVPPTEPALASDETTDSSSIILNVDSATSDPEVEESVVVPIEEEMVFAPREEEVKSPKEKRSSSADVVSEASIEETTVDAVSTNSPDADTSVPSEPPSVIVNEPVISAEEVPSASDVASDPIERPKSPWTPSYSVMQVGSGVEVIDRVNEEVPPAGDLTSMAAPKADASEPERPSSTWTPSYSTTSQGSRSPSPLPDAEQPATRPLSEATVVEDVPTVAETKGEPLAEPPSIMITSQSQSDEVEAPPALEVETKVEQDAPERPKSPWTPSYSVTTQGSPLIESAELPHPLIESDVTNVVFSPVPPPVVVELPVPEVSVSIAEAEPHPINVEIVEPVSSIAEDQATTVEPVLDVEPLSIPGSSADEPHEVQRTISPSLHVTLADVPESSVDAEQAPPAPEILSASLSRSKSTDSLTPDDIPERPKSPWTPSYSVTSQGSPSLAPKVLTEEPPSIEVGTDTGAESLPTVETLAQPSVGPSPVEAIVAPVPERPKSPWTPSYSVTRQGSTPPSPQPAPAPTELVVNADIDAQSDTAAASLATEGPSSPRSTLADLDSDTFSDVSDQRIPDSEETQPAVVQFDVENPQDVEAFSQTPVLSTAQLTEETITTPTDEVPEPSMTITVNEPVLESNPQTPRNEPSEEQQAFPLSTKPSVSRLDTSGEPHELDTSSSTLETPAQSRKRLESTASSRFFPGGWFSTSPTIGGRTSLENAQGEFSALKSPIDMAGTTAPATTPVDGLAEDEERKSRWCTIM